MAVYGYARVSTQEQVLGTSLSEQARRIRGVAQALGLEEPDVVADAGVSGSVPLDLRAAGGPLFERLSRGDTLIVMKLDRAFRSAEDALEKARRLGERGVDLVVADIGLEPIQRNGVGKLVFTILAGVAEMERDRIIERVTDGQRAKAAKGGYTGGYVPYGYTVSGQGKDAVLVEVAEEQEVIRKVYEALDLGLSLRAVADVVGVDWNMVRRLKDRRGREVKK